MVPSSVTLVLPLVHLPLVSIIKGYIGIMDKKDEATIKGLGFRAYLWFAGNEGMEKEMETRYMGLYRV